MKDIHNIQWILLDNLLNYKISILYAIFAVFVLGVLYFLKNYKKEVIIKETLEKPKEKINYVELLNKIPLDLEKNIFYGKLMEVLKKFLEEKTKKSFSKMTLEELKKLNLNKNLFEFIKEIYFLEYDKDSFEDNLEKRKNILEKAKKICKKF